MTDPVGSMDVPGSFLKVLSTEKLFEGENATRLLQYSLNLEQRHLYKFEHSTLPYKNEAS